MSTFKSFIICASLLLAATDVFPQTTGSESNGQGTPVSIERVSLPVKRPRAPYAQAIICTYDETGYLHLNFKYSEGISQLTVDSAYSGISSDTYNFDSSFPCSIYIGPVEQAHLHIVTSNGNEYEGYID